MVPVAISENFALSEKEFDSQCPVILQVGTAANKNLPRLAEALRGVRCRLRIVGPLSESQKELLKVNGIEFEQMAGISQRELISCYCKSDLVTFASTSEGFGMPILEANATGRPVVTSNVTSMPEVAGDAACLVDPFDVDSIRDGILRIMENPDYREMLIKNGFRNVKRYQPATIAAQYIAIYDEILGR
ncbi:glycosyltransferase [Rhodopirellula baltica]|uniref:glycosyltransferase n=1 Tax=Rhodopirellula baltica TaxID=265606 RepID=UPI0002F1035E|nr:glycosyltransferase [Rhodopirellula baltica]